MEDLPLFQCSPILPAMRKGRLWRPCLFQHFCSRVRQVNQTGLDCPKVLHKPCTGATRKFDFDFENSGEDDVAVD